MHSVYLALGWWGKKDPIFSAHIKVSKAAKLCLVHKPQLCNIVRPAWYTKVFTGIQLAVVQDVHWKIANFFLEFPNPADIKSRSLK